MTLQPASQPAGSTVSVCHDAREVTDEALSYLRRVVAARPGGRHTSHAIAAASRLLEWARWREEFDEDKRRFEDPLRVFTELLGSEQKLLEWIERVHPALKARVNSR